MDFATRSQRKGVKSSPYRKPNCAQPVAANVKIKNVVGIMAAQHAAEKRSRK
jgi:hypothetical protein